MSHGQLDTAAHEAAKRAVADAGKRGLRVTGMTAHRIGGTRSFTFTLEPIRRQRAAPSTPPDVPRTIKRGGVPTQGSLL